MARKLVLLPILLLALFIIPAAYAQNAVIEQGLEAFLNILGTGGINFLFTFMIVFTIAFAALSIVPIFSRIATTSSNATAPLIALVIALASSFWVYSRQIDVYGV